MIFEILAGTAAGFFLQSLYYEHIFVPYPITRIAILSVFPPLILSFVGAWMVDVVYQSLVGLFRRGRNRGGFFDHALGFSLFVSAFLHIEGAKVGNELHLPLLATPPAMALISALLVWCWARHRSYVALLAQLQEPAPSVQLVEASQRAHDDIVAKKRRNPKQKRNPLFPFLRPNRNMGAVSRQGSRQ